MTFMGLFKTLTIAVILAMTALMISQGDPTKPKWWLGAVLFWFWLMAPIWAPYQLARIADSLAFTIPLGVFFLIATLLTGWAYYTTLFPPTSSTGALIFVVMPLYQWVGFIVIAAISSLLHTWLSPKEA